MSKEQKVDGALIPQKGLLDEMMARDSSICSVMDPDGHIVYVSPFFNSVFGTSSSDLVGKLWIETKLPESFSAAMDSARAEVVRTNRAATISIDSFMSLDLPVYEASLSPTYRQDGTMEHIVSFYISNAEKDVRLLIDYFMDHILNKLQEANDIDDAVPNVLSYISSSFNADIVTLLFRHEGEWYPRYVHGANDTTRDVIFIEEQATLAHLIEKRREVFTIYQNDTASPFAKMLRRAWGIRSMAAIPMQIQGEVFAILTISNRNDRRPYTQYQMDALKRAASIMALAFSEDRYIWSRGGEGSSFMNIIDSTEIGSALIGKDGSIIWSSGTYDEVIPIENRGMGIFELSYYTLSDRLSDAEPSEVMRRVIATGKALAYGCFQRRNKSGAITYWQVSFMPVGGGRDQDILCVVTNISGWEESNKKAARLTYAIQEEHFRVETLLDSVPVGVYISNAEGRILEISNKGQGIWGNKALPRDIEDYGEYIAWYKGTRKRLKLEDWPIVKAVRKGQTTVGDVIEYQNFEGKRGTIINSASPIKNRNGEVIGAVEIDHDITEMTRLEDQLMAAKASLEAIINQMPAGVAIAEASSGRIISCNDELMRMCPLHLGMPQSVEDYARWGLLDPIDLRPIQPDQHPMAIALNENRAVTGIELAIRSNKGYMTIMSSASPVVDGEGKAIGVVSIFTDITKQKEAERRLEKQTMDLARFNADLQRFAYVTSNELRESLKSITNYLSLIDKNSS